MEIFDFNKEPKEKSNLQYYLLAFIVGVMIFLVLLYLGKGFFFLVGYIIIQWKWIIAGIVILFIIKKIFFKKKGVIVR